MCVCVLFGLFLSLSLSCYNLFVWWRYCVRACVCVCDWDLFLSIWYCFKLIGDRKWLRQEMKSKSEEKWKNQKWIYANKFYGCYCYCCCCYFCCCCCCWFCTHTHNDRPSLRSMWTKNIRNFVNTLHTAIIERRAQRTYTHLWLTTRFLFFNTIVHKFLLVLSVSRCVVCHFFISERCPP